MSTLLLIETATTACSVALASNNSIIAQRHLTQRNAHSEMITVFIDDVLAEAGISIKQVDAVAVSCGPGSYTGLRIGVSTAKGLCYATDKPLISISTLKAMAQGALQQYAPTSPSNTLLCPMIDARRMEVYTAIYDSNLKELSPVEAKIIDGNSFTDVLNQQTVLFFGDGAPKCREVLGQHPNALFVDDFENSAIYLLTEALQKLQQQDFEDVAYFQPYYLKDFIAGPKAGA